VTGFKAMIVVVWLTVPASLGFWLHADREQYEAESLRQARLCKERADALSSNTAVMKRQALRLSDLSDGHVLRQWRRDWSAARRESERQLPKLASSALNHYPATATLLASQEDSLNKLIKTADSAAKDWDYFLRGREVLMGLAQDIDYTRYQARFYSMLPNGRGIYFALQEQLATLESRYQAQDSEQARLYERVRLAMADVDKQGREIQNGLGRLAERMSEDEKRTYAESVRMRYENFDLREALVGIIQQAASTASAAKNQQAQALFQLDLKS
jgi:hypothetical protein